MIPGLHCSSDGSVGLSGALLELFESIDARFRRRAAGLHAEPIGFGPTLPVASLRAADYFSSFPHQVMAPVSPGRSSEELQAFRDANGKDGEGPLQLGRLSPVESVLAPAACYALYPTLAGAHLEKPRTFTLLCTCFRREKEFLPLRRQSCFRMREIVHVGDVSSARLFREAAEAAALAVAAELRLPLAVTPATDLFFDAARSPRHLHQKLFPAKHEFVFDDGLAIGSVNVHRTFFADLHSISCGGSAAQSACLAFGVERWLWAVLRVHGTDSRSWPT
jgi:hypothetical protein